MKQLFTLLICFAFALNACKKNSDEVTNLSKPSTNSFQAKSSGSGSGGSGGGSGGGGNTTGFIQSVLSGTASRLVSGNTDSIYITFTQPAPAAGWTLVVTTSDPAVQAPSTVFVPAGSTNVRMHVTGGTLASAKSVTVNVQLGSQTKSTTLKVFPLTYSAFPAPSLQSPGNGSKFNYHIMITFQWSANVNAYNSELQFGFSPSFSPTEYVLIFDRTNWPGDYFDGTGVRYWRVRYLDASGNPGPWSAIRNFEVKPQ
jgi:hypothetical protein